MVVAACQFGAGDKFEFADGAVFAQIADLGAASCAEVAAAGGQAVAGTETRGGFEDAGGEAHHDEGGFDGLGGGAVVHCWWGGGAHQEVSIVGFGKGDGVGF